jgi:Right handed beta helix region
MNLSRLFFVVLLAMSMHGFAQTRHYLDCAGGDDARDGLSPQSAWKTVEKANGLALRPGDSLMLRRGSVCEGMLTPQGSGTEAQPITLGAYESGPQPRMIGTGHEAALKLDDQQFWEIANLNLTGGSPYGLFVTGSAPQLSHIHIRNVVVHDVTGEPKHKDTGLVVVSPRSGAPTIFNDVLIDGVTAYGTTEWGGIFVNGASYSATGHERGTNITVRNSIVHDVGGDGIFVGVARHVLIERNVAWNTGMQYTESIGTPDGIWEWMCEDCLVQYNEGFLTDSPGVDGGVFDIDFGNVNNTVQYNFGHDSQGYCVSIFGAEGAKGFSRNAVIRKNVCVNNGRSPRLAKRQGAVYLATWNGGKLNGVQIYNNTIYWNPPLNTAAIVNEAEIEAGTPRFVRDNLIVSSAAAMLRSEADLDLSGNEYWHPLDAQAEWTYNKIAYHDLAGFRVATGQDTDSREGNPHLNKVLQPVEALGSASLPACGQAVYGQTASAERCGAGALLPARSSSVKGLTRAPASIGGQPYHPKNWTLLALLTPEGHGESEASRSQFVVLQSMLQQFAALGLHVDAVPATSLGKEQARDWVEDWNFGAVRLVTSTATQLPADWWPIGSTTGLALISPEGKILRAWGGVASFAEVELTLRNLIGTPPGMQPIALAAEDRERR